MHNAVSLFVLLLSVISVSGKVTYDDNGKSCHKCGWCSTAQSPFQFDFDLSSLHEADRVSHTQRSPPNEQHFFALPCGGLKERKVPNFKTGECAANMTACFCSPDWGNGTCRSIGYYSTAKWKAYDHNTLIQETSNPGGCLFESNKTATTIIIYACKKRAKDIDPNGDPFQEAREASFSKLRDTFCGPKKNNHCNKCMHWLTDVVCTPPGSIKIENITSSSTQVTINVDVETGLLLDKKEAEIQLFINDKRFPDDKTAYTTLPITYTFSQFPKGKNQVKARIAALANELYKESDADSAVYEYTCEKCTADLDNGGASLRPALWGLILGLLTVVRFWM